MDANREGKRVKQIDNLCIKTDFDVDVDDIGKVNFGIWFHTNKHKSIVKEKKRRSERSQRGIIIVIIGKTRRIPLKMDKENINTHNNNKKEEKE